MTRSTGENSICLKFGSSFFCLICAALGFSLVSCSPPVDSSKPKVADTEPSKPTPPSIDATKFEATYRSVKVIQGSQTIGVSLTKFRESLQALATEVSIAEDKASSPDEQEVVRNYREILEIYKDSLTIWEQDLVGHSYRGGTAGLPIGEVNVKNFAPLVEKYKLPTKPHRQEGSGYEYRTVRSDSTQLLWKLAAEKVAAIAKKPLAQAAVGGASK